MRLASILVLLCAWFPSTASAQPSARVLIEAAIAQAGLEGPLDTWSSRARWANAVPELEVVAEGSRDRDTEDHYRETLAESDIDLFAFKSLQTTNAEDSGRRASLRIKLRWKPAGLVFDSNELAAERMARQRSDDRAALIAKVSTLYSHYIGLRRRIRRGDETEEELIEIIRVEAELDALTGGALSRSYKEKNP